ncbi:MAG: hypothetical protein ACOZHQ_18905 [Thermodesulfobacteriota bacterium]
MAAASGAVLPLAALGRFEPRPEELPILHKDLKRMPPSMPRW